MLKKLLCLLMILASFKGYAQESVTFKAEVKPNKKYSVVFKSTSKSEVEILADEETRAKMAASGTGATLTVETLSSMQTELVTAARDQNGEIPAQVDFRDLTTATTLNGATTTTKNPISGSKILGRYGTDNKFKMDSLTGNLNDLPMREALTSMLDKMQAAVLFPEKPMKVGERFRSETPMSIPISGMNPVAMNIETEYLLTAIRGGTAYFDLVQSMTLSMSNEQVDVSASGSGTGKLEYDIAENHATKFLSDLPMEMTLKFNENLSMKMKTTMITEQWVQIE